MSKDAPVISRWASFFIFCAVAGCGPAIRSAAPSLPSTENAASFDSAVTGAGKIKHVVYIVQENRSFDDLFQGYPGADTVARGKDSKGGTIGLTAISLKLAYSLNHSGESMFVDCNGPSGLPGTKCRMNGFDREGSSGGPPGVTYPMYAYAPHKETAPYFAMAHEWVLADRMFASQLDESFVAHQYIIAAQAESSVDVPFGRWGCGGGQYDYVHMLTKHRAISYFTQRPCFSYETLGDELDGAHLSWRFYTSHYMNGSSDGGALWSAYQAVGHIYNGPDWKKVITPQKTFLTDVAHGELSAFTWITPTCANSDHVGCGGGGGPSWVTALVNAIGKSRFWDSTAVFVQWDDWGGLYDHVPPPFKDYDSVGFRVPLLVISPYAKQNYVSHVQYETASVLRFAEDLYGLAQLSAADKRAASPAKDCFDFSQQPRKFVPIKAPLDASYFMREPPDLRPPDDQ